MSGPQREGASARVDEAFAADAAAFKALFGQAANPSGGRTVLILDRGSTGYIRYEIYLYRLLQMRGYTLVCVGWRQPDVVRYYELLNIPYHYWEEFTPHADATDVRARLGELDSADAIRRVEIDGVGVGLHALAECLRADYLERRRASVAYGSEVPAGIEPFLVRGLQALAAGTAILERFRPDTVIFGDGLYTLQGTFLDLAVSRGIDAIYMLPALEDGTLYLKRCTPENRDWPYTFLSTALWARILTAGAWNQALRASFHDRHRQGYLSGGWCSLQAITKNTDQWRPEDTRRHLGLDHTGKIALVCPHLVWDTPVYGQNLFPDHASWLIAVVRAAVANPRIRWVIKLHPANLFSTQNEDFKASTNFAELGLLANAVGPLPPHVHVPHAEREGDHLRAARNRRLLPDRDGNGGNRSGRDGRHGADGGSLALRWKRLHRRPSLTTRTGGAGQPHRRPSSHLGCGARACGALRLRLVLPEALPVPFDGGQVSRRDEFRYRSRGAGSHRR